MIIYLLKKPGISEPIPFSKLVSFIDEENNIDLSKFSYVDTMVTVVDSFNFFKDFGSPETLRDRKMTDMGRRLQDNCKLTNRSGRIC